MKRVYENFSLILILLCLLQGAGISGIKVHRITRVHNRILRTKFDDKLDQILDRDDIVDLTKYDPIFHRLLILITTNNSLVKYRVSTSPPERSLSCKQ